MCQTALCLFFFIPPFFLSFLPPPPYKKCRETFTTNIKSWWRIARPCSPNVCDRLMNICCAFQSKGPWTEESSGSTRIILNTASGKRKWPSIAAQFVSATREESDQSTAKSIVVAKESSSAGENGAIVTLNRIGMLLRTALSLVSIDNDLQDPFSFQNQAPCATHASSLNQGSKMNGPFPRQRCEARIPLYTNPL